MRGEEPGETLLSKRLALPIFASAPLSSVAYATQGILLVLTLGGLAYLHFTPWTAAGVVPGTACCSRSASSRSSPR